MRRVTSLDAAMLYAETQDLDRRPVIWGAKGDEGVEIAIPRARIVHCVV